MYRTMHHFINFVLSPMLRQHKSHANIEIFDFPLNFAIQWNYGQKTQKNI